MITLLFSLIRVRVIDWKKQTNPDWWPVIDSFCLNGFAFLNVVTMRLTKKKKNPMEKNRSKNRQQKVCFLSLSHSLLSPSLSVFPQSLSPPPLFFSFCFCSRARTRNVLCDNLHTPGSEVFVMMDCNDQSLMMLTCWPRKPAHTPDVLVELRVRIESFSVEIWRVGRCCQIIWLRFTVS